jgi:ABC-type transport system involved in multi-copper enzyme maturation permease subunit
LAPMILFDIQDAFGTQYNYPDFMTMELLTTALIVWTIVPFLLSILRFRRRDL